MATLLFAVVLLPLALILTLPSLVDVLAWFHSFRSVGHTVPQAAAGPTLLFLVPAHDEELLIRRTIRSLRAQDYPRERLRVLVVADNCSDRTAAVAAAAGADVLERTDSELPGKHHAIGWALSRVEGDRFDAVVIIDADTLVDPGFSRALAATGPLHDALAQGRVGVSNERENWLTLLAGVLTYVRWDIVIDLKERAGLSCPLTGNGSVIGRRILRRFPWNVETVTEGWELYARLTLEGLHTHYVPGARLWAQEARSLAQGASQRSRWTAGRLAVLRRYGRQILDARRVTLVQRLDLLAELSSLGPVTGAGLGLAGAAAAWLVLAGPWGAALAVCCATGFVRPGVYTVLGLRYHPTPVAALLAFTRLPLYVGWRMALAVRTLLTPSAGHGRWVRSERHDECSADEGDAPDRPVRSATHAPPS